MMKKVVFVGLALASISLSAAQGADLRPVYKAQPLPFVPQFSWTGFYVGVHLGAGWGTTEADDPNLNGCTPSNNTPKKCADVGGTIVDGGGGEAEAWRLAVHTQAMEYSVAAKPATTFNWVSGSTASKFRAA